MNRRAGLTLMSHGTRQAQLTLWRLVGTAVFFAVAGIGAAHADITVKPVARGYDIDVTSETTASELVDAIANATGVDIKGEPEDTTVGVNHLRSASLERALRALLPKAPFVVRSDADDTPTEIIFLAPRKNGDGSSDGTDDGSYDGNDGSDGSIDSIDPTDVPPDAGMSAPPDSPDTTDPGGTGEQ